MGKTNLCSQEISTESKFMALIRAPGTDYPRIITIKEISDYNKE